MALQRWGVGVQGQLFSAPDCNRSTGSSRDLTRTSSVVPSFPTIPWVSPRTPFPKRYKHPPEIWGSSELCMVLEPWPGPVPAHKTAWKFRVKSPVQGAALPGIKWKWVNYTTFLSILKWWVFSTKSFWCGKAFCAIYCNYLWWYSWLCWR